MADLNLKSLPGVVCMTDLNLKSLPDAVGLWQDHHSRLRRSIAQVTYYWVTVQSFVGDTWPLWQGLDRLVMHAWIVEAL